MTVWPVLVAGAVLVGAGWAGYRELAAWLTRRRDLRRPTAAAGAQLRLVARGPHRRPGRALPRADHCRLPALGGGFRRRRRARRPESYGAVGGAVRDATIAAAAALALAAAALRLRNRNRRQRRCSSGT
jgi:hypothetical protein